MNLFVITLNKIAEFLGEILKICCIQAMNMVYLIHTATIDNTKFGKALFDRMDLLKRHFMKTYGVPQYDKSYPKQEKMNNGKAFYAYMWKVGRKEIFVGIALEETDRGDIYYVLCHIDRKGS